MHLCSSLVPKECYPYLVSVRNEQRVSKKCRLRDHMLRAIYMVHLWDFTMECVHFRCPIKHLCSSLVPKECYPSLVSVRNEQGVSKKCRVREQCTYGILPWTVYTSGAQ